MDDPLGLTAIPRHVDQAELVALHHGCLHLVEQRRGWGTHPTPVPGLGIHHDRHAGGLGVVTERFGEGPDQFAQGRLHLRGGGRRTRHQEESACLGLGEPAQVGLAAARQAPPPGPALDRVDRQAGHPEGLQVTPGGPFRHLQLLGDLTRRHLATGLEQQQDGNETIGAHVSEHAR